MRKASGGTEAPIAPSAIPTWGGVPLARDLRRFYEPRLGADLSGVRIHTDSTASSLAHSLRARAFTLGPDVFFRRGEWRPQTAPGRELLAHELVHTVQQRGATVQRAPAEDAETGGAELKAASDEKAKNTYVFEYFFAVLGDQKGIVKKSYPGFVLTDVKPKEVVVGEMLQARPSDTMVVRLKWRADGYDEPKNDVSWNSSGLPTRPIDGQRQAVVKVQMPDKSGGPPQWLEATPKGEKSVRIYIQLLDQPAPPLDQPTPKSPGQKNDLPGQESDLPGQRGCKTSCSDARKGQLVDAITRARTQTSNAISMLADPSFFERDSKAWRAFRKNFFPSGMRPARRDRREMRKLCKAEYRAEKGTKTLPKRLSDFQKCVEEGRRADQDRQAASVRLRVLDVLQEMRNNLDSGARFSCPETPDCCDITTGGYVQDIARPAQITVCPRYFGEKVIIRNTLHEFAHSVGVGFLAPFAPGDEYYRTDSRWDSLSSDVTIHLADAYAMFVTEVNSTE